MKSLSFTLLFLFVTAFTFASQEKKTLKLRIQSPTGNLSDATMYFDQGISGLYDIHEDAALVADTVPGIPQIYSITNDSIPCSINGCGTLSSSSIISIGYHIGFKGLYALTASLLDNFDPTSIIQLEDRTLGVFTDLRENFYQVELDTTSMGTGRFFIHVSAPAQFSSTASNCADNGGSISVTTDNTITWNTCQLYNSVNALVGSHTNVSGTVTFDGLSSGGFHIVFTFNQYSTTHDFHLDGNYVTAGITTPTQTLYTNEDITFSANATNANQFSWDFGDGTLIDGVENPIQVYREPGVYTVNVSCANNLGCSANSQISVTVQVATAINEANNKSISIYNAGKNITVNMNGTANENAQLEVTNLLGQTVYHAPFTAQSEQVTLATAENGYYVVSLKNAGKTTTKRIFINQ